ncbi:MAG: drug/metabolite transporter (DMT)-like permease [Paracoccaceae bacterium]|jgi:drug/metabolite transporter (DMT)-like permease
MENLRGIGLMIVAMAAFTIADTFIKKVSNAIPVGEILLFMGIGGLLIFSIWAKSVNQKLFGADFFSRLNFFRSLGEMIGTFGFVTALALSPISSASAILQATPLVITLGAALFLKESVGWRRWTASFIGFAGVLLIVQPGMAAFQPASLFAVLAVIGLSIRDLATRSAPKSMTSIRLGVYGFASVIPTGTVLTLIDGPFVVPDISQAATLSLSVLFAAAGYHMLTLAMRMGDVSIIAPFRYVRIIFAIGMGILVFGEVIDFWMIAGSIIVVASGLYTFAREGKRRG